MLNLPRLAVFIFLVFLLGACQQETVTQEVPVVAADTTHTAPEPTLLYGFAIDSFPVVEKKMK